jgi:hypothetical protein
VLTITSRLLSMRYGPNGDPHFLGSLHATPGPVCGASW